MSYTLERVQFMVFHQSYCRHRVSNHHELYIDHQTLFAL